MINSISNSTRLTMGGLATGLDTQSIIKQLTYATQLKIDSKKQSVQKLEWKADIYRDITSSLNSFKDTYFSFSSKNNLLSNSFYTNGKISCNSPYVTVTGNSSSAQNIIIKDIQQLATKSTIVPSGSLTQGAIKSENIEINKQVNNLAGESITLSYNSKNYTVSFDKNFNSTNPETISNYINDQLKSNPELVDESGNLKVSFEVTQGEVAGSQAFSVINNAGTGSVKIAAGTKNALTALGFSVSSTAEDKLVSSDINTSNFTTTLNLSDTLKGGYIKLNLDGVEKTVTFNDLDFEITSVDQLCGYLNTKIEQAFPGGKISATASGNSFSLTTSSSSSVLTINGASDNLLGSKGILGIEKGSTNRVNLGSSLSGIQFNSPLVGDAFSIKVNGKEFNFTASDSLNTVINTINSSGCGVKLSYSNTSNKLMAESTSTGNVPLEIEDISGNLTQALFGDNFTLNQGSDAKIVVSLDGGLTQTTIERPTNSFALDGVNITLNSMAIGDIAEEIKISVEPNTEEIVSSFEKFVEDYNNLIDKMNGYTKTKPNNEYKPLTDEQKKEMSESEIALWEKKAKEGLVYADSNINSLVSEMKSALTSIVGESSLTSDIGLKFDSYHNGGKLIFDKDKFTKTLSENPDKIISTFTQKSTVDKKDDYKTYYKESGAFNRISDVIDKYASVYQNKGIFVTKAGVKGTSTDKDNYIYKDIERYNTQINSLLRKLSIEETRYRKQFTALETNINNLNAQSNMFLNG